MIELTGHEDWALVVFYDKHDELQSAAESGGAAGVSALILQLRNARHQGEPGRMPWDRACAIAGVRA